MLPLSKLLLLAMLSVVLVVVDCRPQAVALGPRPAVMPDPIMIENEEAMGKPMSDVVEDVKPEPVESGVDEDEAAPQTIPPPGSPVVVVDDNTGSVKKGEVVSKSSDGTALVATDGKELNTTATANSGSDKDKDGLPVGIIVALVVLVLLILFVVLFWFCRRHQKKKALRAAGQTHEVKSVTPVQTADGPAEVVKLEPMSTGTTSDGSGAPAPAGP